MGIKMKIIITDREGKGDDKVISIGVSGFPNNSISLEIKGKDGNASCKMDWQEAEEIGDVLSMMAKKLKSK